MPPKKYSNITATPRRTARATARKSTIPANLSHNSSSAKSSTAVDNSSEIRTTTKESPAPPITSCKHKTAPKSSPATAPTPSSEASPNSIAPKTNTKDVSEEPHTVPIQSEAIPFNMESEITSQIGVEQTLVEKVSPPPEKCVIEGEQIFLETHVERTTISPKEEPHLVGASDSKSLYVEPKITDRVEQTLVGKASAPPENAVIGAEKTGPETSGGKTKATVKKTIRIVKKVVKKKVLKKIPGGLKKAAINRISLIPPKKEQLDLLNEVPEMLGSSATNAETPSAYVLGLEFDEAKNTVPVTETQLKDQNVNPLRDQNHQCTSGKNLDLESGDGRREEEMKEKVENNDVGGLKMEALLDDGVLSGEMEALERRRRRKTEIFIGGLDKETKEEDIRKVFEEVGEVVEVRLAMSGKTRKNRGFAFVRYALATDAKKALAKYHKVEICGRQCATSPVEGNDTLFLGNIDKRWKSDDVVKLLQSIGIEKIDHVTVIADPNKTELNRGFAFLELETNKDAQYAYKKLQNKGVFGKNLHIKVAWAEPLIEPDEQEMLKVQSIYAEYLPYSWDEEKVKDCFCKFGEIENVVLAKDMPSSRRKDFAFVNYTTREAALACIEAFNREQIDDEGSKVKVKVSLAKPIPKGQQMKHSRTPPSKELSKEKHMGTQPVIKLHEVRNMRKATSSNSEDIRVDPRSSTTSELVQLLREQASSRPAQPGLGIGSVNLECSYPSPGRKRPFPLLGDDSHFSDPRGHPRARVEGSYPIAHPSAFTRGVGMTSLPHHHRQIAGYTSESFYRVEDYPNYVQPRDRDPYHGSSGIYRRY